MANRKLVVEIVGSEQDLLRSFKKSSQAANKFDKDMERTSRGVVAGTLSFRGLGRAAAFASGQFLGGVGVGFAIKSTLSRAEEGQRVLSQTARALHNVGLSWADYGDQIQKAALAQANLSGFDDERLLGTFATFVRRTKDVNEALRLNAVSADVARGRNIEFEQASQLVLKASIGQAGALRRLGIDAAKGASATQLLTLLQQQYSGAAEAFGKTAVGSQERFRVALENVQETIGTLLLPKVATLADDLSTAAVAAQRLVIELQKLGRIKVPGGTTAGGLFGGLFTTGVGLAKQTGALGQVLAQGGLLKPGETPLDALHRLNPKVIPATGVSPFGTTLDLLTGKQQPQPGGLFGGAKKLPVMKELTVAIQTAEVDARISGSTKRLRAILVKEANLLKDTLINAYGLTPKERLSLKQSLLGVTSEIKSIDDAAAADAKAAADAARERRKAAAEAAKEAAQRAKERAKAALAARAAARNARQFKLLGLTATGEERAPGVKALRATLGSFTEQVAGTFLDTNKTRSLLARIRKVLSGGLGAIGRDVRLQIKSILSDLDTQLKQHSGNQTKFRHASVDALLSGLGLAPDELRRVRQRLAMVGPGGTIPQPSRAFNAAGAIVVQSDLYVDGQKLASNTTKHQRKDSTRRTTSRRGPYAGRH